MVFYEYIIPPPADFPAQIKNFSGKSAKSYSNIFTVILLLKIISLHARSIYGIITTYDFIDSAVHQRNVNIGFIIFWMFFPCIAQRGERTGR